MFDYRALPLRLVATLCSGLPKTSRIFAKMMKLHVNYDTFLIARIVDELSAIHWLLTVDGKEGKNRPQPLTPLLIDKDKPDEEKEETFDSPDDFEAFRRSIFSQAPERGD